MCTGRVAITTSSKPWPSHPIALAVFAFLWWGLVPAYWKQLPLFSAEELVLYRILFSSLLLLPVLLWRREFSALGALLRQPRSCFGLMASSILIGFNWYLYVWAIAHERVVEASLGYFLNPLVNVALGTLFLKERMSQTQRCACGLAALGTALLAWQTQALPWIPLLLALSFATYGLLRKILQLPTLPATTLESLLLSAPAALLLVGLHSLGSFSVHLPQASTSEIALLSLCGVVSTVPLLAFAEAAKQLPLSALGFLQFLSPSLQFLLGVFAYHEPFGTARWLSFSLIWGSLLLFLWELRRKR